MSEPAHRYLALDSLRGVCACMIVLLHLKTFGIINGSTFVQDGFLFVDFFFVLSGFVITASYGDKLAEGFSIQKFMILRLGRIYPLHLFMLGIFLTFEIVYATGIMGSADRRPFGTLNSLPMLIANLLLLQTFIGGATSWNYPSWSIAVEVWTYLLFAFVFRFAGRALIPITLLLAAACCIYLPFTSPAYLNAMHDGALVRCIYGFSLGVLCFKLHRSGRICSLGATLGSLAELAVICLVVAIVSLAGAGPLSLAVPPIFFIAVFVYSQEQGVVSVLLKRRFLAALGTWSYSIYMVHLFLELRVVNALTLVSHGRLVASDSYGKHVGGSPLFGDAVSIAVLGLTIFVASVTYRRIEKPAKDWSRRLIRSQSPALLRSGKPTALVSLNSVVRGRRFGRLDIVSRREPLKPRR